MASTDVVATLRDKLASIHSMDASERSSGYLGVLDWGTSSIGRRRRSVGGTFALTLTTSTTTTTVLEQPMTASRTLLAALMATLESATSMDDVVVKQLANAVINKIAPRAVSYEDQLVKACEFLSGVYVREGLHRLAADTLRRIDLESGMRQVDARVKLDLCLRVCHLYLMDKSFGDADASVKKAMSLLGGLDEGKAVDRELVLRYLSCSARVSDGRHKFIEAAMKYLELARKMANSMDDDDDEVLGLGRVQALESAVACALLADAGPQRSRLLAQLYRDDEVKTLSGYLILEKVFLERLVEGDDVEAFRQALGHDRGEMKGRWGLDVVQLAIVQHNLSACSKLYTNVELGNLAGLFGVEERVAVGIVSAMLLEGRLVGRIDQVDGVVMFDVEDHQVDGEEREKESGGNHVEEAIMLADAALAEAVGRYGEDVVMTM